MPSDIRTAFPFPDFSAGRPVRPTEADVFEEFDNPSTARRRSADPSTEPDRYLSEIQEKVAEIEKDAYEKAFLLGEKAGRELGEATMTTQVENMAFCLDEIAALRKTILREAEKDLVELSFRIARAIVGAELALDPGKVFESARKSISRLEGTGRATVRLNPADIDAVWSRRTELAPWLEGRGDLRVESDPRIERGGCLAYTEDSEVDATIEGQFTSMRDEFLRRVEEHE